MSDRMSLIYGSVNVIPAHEGKIMESLESRIARLTPEQQQEVGDFVDFLLLKNNVRQTQEVSRPSLIMVNTPPVMVPDAPPDPWRSPAIPPEYQNEIPRSPVADPEPPVPVIHEIAGPANDGITRDYMDYSQFEETPLPATEAVHRARKKALTKKETDKTRHLLEWVD